MYTQISRFPRNADPSRPDFGSTMAQATTKKEKSASSAPQISLLQFFLASLLFQFFLSYVITETWIWGYKGKWTYVQNWKALFVPSLLRVLANSDSTTPPHRNTISAV